ncbi:diguanylate cyclase with PAS/PAC sensor [[Leptolyngbya] sp. PCC 7376]|uniref:ammonium transporter n=1 Tax=[Leptolyngbya] sp. PCC 7376 TaxID=111781 RepID=UPI00029F2365|nr:ammonium transporter [[Leptolyngbya] sp. PCC 7376]AFY37625.1 diguanylate cyclase with PAS/PAC sensor [[Leptolyngbya] sp. PCC 7376]
MDSSLNILWVIFCAILVSTMQAGFCCLESGLVRAKNSINVAIKNLVDFCVASLLFSMIGCALMFGESHYGLVGGSIPPVSEWTGEDYSLFLFFVTFCGTATTIVSGAVAERMSFFGYFIVAVILSTLVYPVTGHWVWGGQLFQPTDGWLGRLQFHDFAGSTVVHSVGGWMALAAILIIGPRIGRFTPKLKNIDGDNLPTAVLGVFLLWFGWFGFNGGSTLAFTGLVPQILVNTAQGGAAGGLTALFTTWYFDRKPKVPLVMNGVVAGLVSVTAGCDVMSLLGAICAGAIGGVLCTIAARVLVWYRLDDPVGVVSAHLICGIWGTLAVPLFRDPTLWDVEYSLWRLLGIQILGVITVAFYSFSVSYLLLKLINHFVPLRVTANEERMGLNVAEHGAGTATQDLIKGMNEHLLLENFTQPIFMEPETDMALIASHYNRVLAKMNQIRSELNASHDQLLRVLNSPAFPVVISDRTTSVILFINQQAAELFGFSLQEVGRYHELDFWYTSSERRDFLNQIQQDGQIESFEARFCRVNQETFWSLISGLEIIYDGYQCVLFSFSDISVHIQRERQLHFLAMRDELTGLYNRRAFFEEAKEAIAHDQIESGSSALMMLDVDYFKRVNDQFGHGMGDLVLKEIAQQCRRLVEQNGFMGRLEGEEFAIMLLQAPLEEALAIAEELRQTVENSRIPGNNETISVTISIGLTMVQEAVPLDTLLMRADKALYRAKTGGRNRVEQYFSIHNEPI